MDINESLIISIANIHTVDELQLKLKEATEAFLANPDRIVSAATGSGASYSKQANYLPADLVELYTYALQYKRTGEIGGLAQNQWNVVTYYPFNL